MSAEEFMETTASHKRDRTVLPLILIALLPFTASAWFGMSPASGPALVSTKLRSALVFATLLYQHGDEPVAVESTLESEFVFRNDGLEVVELGRVEHSCSCMSPRLTKRSLEPGEIGSLIVPIQTISQSPGPHEYTLNLHYSDPQPRMTTLTVKAVFPEKMIVVQPKELYISQGSDKPTDFSVSISDFRDKPLNARSVETTAAFVSAELHRPNASEIIQAAFSPDEQYPVGVTKINGQVAGGIPAGRHHVLVTVTTDDPEFSFVTIPIQINGPPHPEGQAPIVTPSQIQLVAMDHPKAKREATVKVVMPSSWNVTHATSWPEQLSVVYNKPQPVSEDLKVMTATVKLDEIPAKGITEGVIQLVANEGKDIVTVRVMLYWP